MFLDQLQAHRFVHQYSQLDMLIVGLSDRFLLRRWQEDKWSIQENLAHLGRYQEIFHHRIGQVLAGPPPTFGRYKAEEDYLFAAWLNLSCSEIIRKTQVKRKELSKILFSLDEMDLAKQGQHPKLGWLNISEWIEFFLLHESHHLYSIFWIVYSQNED